MSILRRTVLHVEHPLCDACAFCSPVPLFGFDPPLDPQWSPAAEAAAAPPINLCCKPVAPTHVEPQNLKGFPCACTTPFCYFAPARCPPTHPSAAPAARQPSQPARCSALIFLPNNHAPAATLQAPPGLPSHATPSPNSKCPCAYRLVCLLYSAPCGPSIPAIPPQVQRARTQSQIYPCVFFVVFQCPCAMAGSYVCQCCLLNRLGANKYQGERALKI